MRLLVITNLVLGAILILLLAMGSGKRDALAPGELEKKRSRPPTPDPSGFQSQSSGAGGLRDSAPLVVDDDNTWHLPAKSILTGVVTADTVTPGNPPSLADDICRLLKVTSSERALLDSALSESFERMQRIEAEHLEIKENEDGESWLHIKAHPLEAAENMEQFREAVEQAIGKDRSAILMHTFRPSNYFHTGRETDLSFHVGEDAEGGQVRFNVLQRRDSGSTELGSSTPNQLQRNGFDEVEFRYGHLFDVEEIRKSLPSPFK